MTSPSILMKAHGLRPKKELGQNFLSDPGTAEMIVARSGIGPADTALEIGAGLGSLTIPLSRQAKRVYAVEKDNRLIKILENELFAAGCDNVVLRQEDILKVDWGAMAQEAGQRLFVMGNVPYNISSQILVQSILNRKAIVKAVLMFQKELALRIMSGPGGKSYGRIAAMLGYCATVKNLATLKASLFYPRPNVDSLVLGILFRDDIQPVAADEAFLFKVIKAAFSKRRKTLKNSLAGAILQIDPKTAHQELLDAGIDPVRRSETLSVEEFVRLSNHLYQAGYR